MSGELSALFDKADKDWLKKSNTYHFNNYLRHECKVKSRLPVGTNIDEIVDVLKPALRSQAKAAKSLLYHIRKHRSKVKIVQEFICERLVRKRNQIQSLLTMWKTVDDKYRSNVREACRDVKREKQNIQQAIRAAATFIPDNEKEAVIKDYYRKQWDQFYEASRKNLKQWSGLRKEFQANLSKLSQSLRIVLHNPKTKLGRDAKCEMRIVKKRQVEIKVQLILMKGIFKFFSFSTETLKARELQAHGSLLRSQMTGLQIPEISFNEDLFDFSPRSVTSPPNPISPIGPISPISPGSPVFSNPNETRKRSRSRGHSQIKAQSNSSGNPTDLTTREPNTTPRERHATPQASDRSSSALSRRRGHSVSPMDSQRNSPPPSPNIPKRKANSISPNRRGSHASRQNSDRNTPTPPEQRGSSPERNSLTKSANRASSNKGPNTPNSQASRISPQASDRNSPGLSRRRGSHVPAPDSERNSPAKGANKGSPNRGASPSSPNLQGSPMSPQGSRVSPQGRDRNLSRRHGSHAPPSNADRNSPTLPKRRASHIPPPNSDRNSPPKSARGRSTSSLKPQGTRAPPQGSDRNSLTPASDRNSSTSERDTRPSKRCGYASMSPSQDPDIIASSQDLPASLAKQFSSHHSDMAPSTLDSGSPPQAQGGASGIPTQGEASGMWLHPDTALATEAKITPRRRPNPVQRDELIAKLASRIRGTSSVPVPSKSNHSLHEGKDPHTTDQPSDSTPATRTKVSLSLPSKSTPRQHEGGNPQATDQPPDPKPATRPKVSLSLPSKSKHSLQEGNPHGSPQTTDQTWDNGEEAIRKTRMNLAKEKAQYQVHQGQSHLSVNVVVNGWSESAPLSCLTPRSSDSINFPSSAPSGTPLSSRDRGLSSPLSPSSSPNPPKGVSSPLVFSHRKMPQNLVNRRCSATPSPQASPRRSCSTSPDGQMSETTRNADASKVTTSLNIPISGPQDAAQKLTLNVPGKQSEVIPCNGSTTSRDETASDGHAFDILGIALMGFTLTVPCPANQTNLGLHGQGLDQCSIDTRPLTEPGKPQGKGSLAPDNQRGRSGSLEPRVSTRARAQTVNPTPFGQTQTISTTGISLLRRVASPNRDGALTSPNRDGMGSTGCRTQAMKSPRSSSSPKLLNLKCSRMDLRSKSQHSDRSDTSPPTSRSSQSSGTWSAKRRNLEKAVAYERDPKKCPYQC